MNCGVNRVLLIGRIVETPYWKVNGNERWLCLTLVTVERTFSLHGIIEHKEIHHIRISASNPILSNLHLNKNDLLHVEGRLKTSSFIDPDHIKRYQTEIIASNIEQLRL